MPDDPAVDTQQHMASVGGHGLLHLFHQFPVIIAPVRQQTLRCEEIEHAIRHTGHARVADRLDLIQSSSSPFALYVGPNSLGINGLKLHSLLTEINECVPARLLS